MARPKTKECRSLSVRLDAAMYDRLDAYSKETGQPKTIAIERALAMYIDDYEQKQQIIKLAEEQNQKY